MKTIKFLSMLFAAFTLSFTAASCGDDNDVEDIIENGGKTTSDLKTSDNEITLTIKQPSAYTMVVTALFTNKQCTSYVTKTTYASEILANAAWKSIQEGYTAEDDLTYKRDGNTIIADGSEALKGMPYDIVLQMIQNVKKTFESANK